MVCTNGSCVTSGCKTGQVKCGNNCCDSSSQYCDSSKSCRPCECYGATPLWACAPAGQTDSCGDACGTCGAGKTCDAATHTCTGGNLCQGVACNAGEVCDSTDGVCKCTSSSCPAGQTCNANRRCVTADPCATKVCSATTPVCVNQGGVAVCMCNSTSCPSGQFCNNGACVSKVETNCSDGIDNDLDGLTDCADPDCAGKSCGTGCTCTNGYKAETNCSDGIDNDHDGKTDCADPDCATSAACSGLGADGAACVANSGCQGQRCLDEASSGWPKGTCASDCSTTKTCGAGAGCLQGYCFQSCSCGSAGCAANNGGCRAGYLCGQYTLDSGATGNVCVADCSFNTECVDNTCDLWSGICTPVGTGKKTGEACTAGANCESAWCADEATNGFPGGYCVSPCNASTMVCGGDGVCIPYGTGDGSGVCYDGCASDTDCRVAEKYSCMLASTGKKICFPTGQIPP